MTPRGPLSNLELAELERALLRHARSDRAPAAARERALRQVSAVAGSAGALTSVGVARATEVAATSWPWLVAKAAAIGMSSAVLLIGATQLRSSDAAKTAEPSPPSSARRPSLPRSVGTAERAMSAPPSSADGPRSAADVPPTLAARRTVPAAASLAPAPPPPLRPPSIAPPPASGEPSRGAAQLTRELAELKAARTALTRGDAGTALALLERYSRDYPGGMLAAEAAALRVEALVARGERAEAATLAAAFLRNYPSSPLAARVRALISVAAAP